MTKRDRNGGGWMENTAESAQEGLQSAGEAIGNAAENTADAAKKAYHNAAEYLSGDSEE
ncbi:MULTISPECIES: hypothetical protein [Paenibacillus]|uniref:hypothetical protein n=1 Tax=Paenibacillus TaxID=44249 RepID=UPI0022B8CC7C|nr:hypothetical protein [Paenibacillus caseinilyticus]MCZ8520757.1 hypothetical protein [Paenibacillus caseinilyticus]